MDKKMEEIARLKEETFKSLSKNYINCFYGALGYASMKHDLTAHIDGFSLDAVFKEIIDSYFEKDAEKIFDIHHYIIYTLSDKILNIMVTIKALYMSGIDDKDDMAIMSKEIAFYQTVQEHFMMNLCALKPETTVNSLGLHTLGLDVSIKSTVN